MTDNLVVATLEQRVERLEAECAIPYPDSDTRSVSYGTLRAIIQALQEKTTANGELRRQYAERGVDRAHASWVGEASAEERARELLRLQWAIERGHYNRVECLDGWCGWTCNLATGRRRFYVRWRRLPAWLGDRWRSLLCDLSIWRDKHILRVRNPYEDRP